MARAVKTRSTYRQEQAAATRDRIADAARRLFASDGYGSTSIEAIAAEAGVAVRTVYSAFGTKREILSHICERWLEDARARETVADVLAEPDPDRRLDAAAAWLTNLYAAGFDVVLIFEAATDESPATLTYTFVAGFDGAGHFTIDNVTKQIKLTKALNFEDPIVTTPGAGLDCASWDTMDSAVARPIPGTFATSSTLAARIFLTDPNAFIKACRRVGPRPVIPSRALEVMARPRRSR